MMIEPWHWGVLGLALLILEMFTLGFASLWFGVSALVVALMVWFMPMSVSTQVILWLLLSIICCIVWFRYIQPMMKTRAEMKLGKESILGEIGLITLVPNEQRLGKVRFSIPKLGADEWECRCVENESLSLGDRVMVKNIIGNTLLVIKIKQG